MQTDNLIPDRIPDLVLISKKKKKKKRRENMPSCGFCPFWQTIERK